MISENTKPIDLIYQYLKTFPEHFTVKMLLDNIDKARKEFDDLHKKNKDNLFDYPY